MTHPNPCTLACADGAAVVRSYRRHASLRAALAAGVLSLVAATPLCAATFTVNSTADATDGVCAAGAGGCTLREAIEAAVATPGRDTIRFDGTVFLAGSDSVRIHVVSDLPTIADPAGTVVDGAGASVRVDGGGTIESGLVFTSGSDVALGKVTVANVAVEGFTGDGVHICGGVPPECLGDVSGALVRNVVAVNCDRYGISVDGRINKKPRVIDSVTFGTGADGIHLSASQLMVGARVQGCTATRAARGGIALRAEQQTGSAVVDSFGLKSGDEGIAMTDDGATIKPTISNVVAFANRNGIAFGNAQLTAPKISGAVATMNAVGIKMLVNAGSGTAMTKVVADANTIHGISIEGGSSVTIARPRVVGNTFTGIAVESLAGLTVTDAIAAGNETGIALASSGGVVKRANAAGNRGDGIRVLNPGNSIVDSLALASGLSSAGITITQGNGGNTVQENVAIGNTVDLYDENTDCGTNIWSANLFMSGNWPCIH